MDKLREFEKSPYTVTPDHWTTEITTYLESKDTGPIESFSVTIRYHSRETNFPFSVNYIGFHRSGVITVCKNLKAAKQAVRYWAARGFKRF